MGLSPRVVLCFHALCSLLLVAEPALAQPVFEISRTYHWRSVASGTPPIAPGTHNGEVYKFLINVPPPVPPQFAQLSYSQQTGELADTVVYQPTSSYAGQEIFVLAIENDLTDRANLQITLDLTNTAPSPGPAISATVPVGQNSLSVNVLSQASDPDGDPLYIASGVMLTTGWGTLTIDPSNSANLLYTRDPGAPAEAFTASFVYRVTDLASQSTNTISFDVPACSDSADCNDGDPCTDDACSAGSCSSMPSGGPGCVAEVCEDDSSATDTGCTTGAPHCIGASGMRQCVECTVDTHCDDGIACTADMCSVGVCAHASMPAGMAGSCAGGEVCSGAPTNTCVACGDTSMMGTDAGCMAMAPHCRTTGAAAPVCEACLDTEVGLDVDLGCATGTPLCVGGTCVACTGSAQCDDGSPCTVDSCVTNACEHVAVSAGDPGLCAGSDICSGDPTNVCVPCADTAMTGTDAGCTGAAPHCNQGMAGNTCEVCIDDGAGVDLGCAAGAPNCVVGTNGNECISCESDDECDDGNECTMDTCSAGACANPALVAFTPCNMGMDVCTAASDCEAVAVSIDAALDGSTISHPLPTLGGTGTPGGTVSVSVGGDSVGTVLVDATGAWSLPLTTPLADGPHVVTASLVAGARDATDTAAFTVDTRTDVAITAPLDDAVINDDTPTITGTAQPGATIVATIRNDGDDVSIGTAVGDGSGSWTLDVSSPLTDGRYIVTALATDLDGNMGEASVSFTVDTVTVVSIGAVDPTTGVIAGTGEPGATVFLSVDGVEVAEVTVGQDGTWSFDGDALGVGTHTVTAAAVDTAGNTATDTMTVAVTGPDGGTGADGGMRPDGGVVPDGGAMSGGGMCATHAPAGERWPAAVGLLLVGLALVMRRRL